MSKMLGVFDSFFELSPRPGILSSLNPLNHLHSECVDLDKGILAVSWLNNAPLKGARIFDSGDTIVCFSGDLVDYESIPWFELARIFTTESYDKLANYRGLFAIACYCKKNRKLMLFSDRRSQQALYYLVCRHGFAFSTELSTFCRLLPNITIFNEQWLYDYLFFNYPLQQTTFLRGVYKMPPAAVLSYCFADSSYTLHQYCGFFKRRSVLLRQPESFKLALKTFATRIPPYFHGSDGVGCALSGGWDGRTLLAFAPDRARLTAFTYGVPGCKDLREAADTARKLGIKHRAIQFGSDFVDRLPDYIVDTVFLSCAAEKALRATLKYSYEQLTTWGTNFPLIIGGVGMDGIFRGHSRSPSIVSSDMATVFRTGFTDIGDQFWSSVFRDHYPDFKDNVVGKLNDIRELFGDPASPEHHLLYKLYITHPELFGGELKLASHYTTLRIPSWDDDLISLAFSIRESCLSFSEFTDHRRGNPSEIRLQSYLIENAWPQLARIPVASTRPDIASRNGLGYQLYRVYSSIKKTYRSVHSQHVPLEDWEHWLNSIHRRFVDELVFSESSLIRQYISDEFLKNLQIDRDMHWIGKLLTAEIVLRLVKSHWHKSGW